MSFERYILDDNYQLVGPVTEDLAIEWKIAEEQKGWLDSKLCVDSTRVEGFHVSTVFLGTDQRIPTGQPDGSLFDLWTKVRTGRPRPIVFETMVFGPGIGGLNEADEIQYRYCTRNEARKAHAAILSVLQQHLVELQSLRAAEDEVVKLLKLNQASAFAELSAQQMKINRLYVEIAKRLDEEFGTAIRAAGVDWSIH